MLIGRRDEQRRIDGLLAAARRGESASLVVRGEAGIGKTMLLEHAARAATGMRVLRTRGIESEPELPFSGLLEAFRPILTELRRLPDRQATALRGALALDEPSDDPYAVYAGALGLLSVAAEQRPLLLLIDDAHWLDRGSLEALAFACRRLGNDGIATLWASRPSTAVDGALDGIPELTLDGLPEKEGLALLAAVGGTLAPATARALVQSTGGNPLALVELPRVLTSSQRDGREPIDEPLPTSPALLAAFGRRLEGLTADARRLLVIAAANDSTDLATTLDAGATLRLGRHHVEEAERVGLVTVVDGRLELRHPLVRAAIYGSADPVERRAAHRALADSLTGGASADRRAWHLALASPGRDETVAAELEACAARAQGRSWQAASRAHEQAARLTPDQATRARRLVQAARAWSEAGRNDASAPLLREACRLASDPTVLADAEHLLGRIEFVEGRAEDATALLSRAADRVAGDPSRAARILADAVDPWLVSGHTRRAEETACRAWELSRDEGGSSEIWAALRYGDVLGWQGEVERAEELWRQAAAVPHPDDPQSLCARGEALFSAGDDEAAAKVLGKAVAATRTTGSPGHLPYALHSLALVETRRGRLRNALGAADEAAAMARDLGQPREHVMAVRSLGWITALLGREDEARGHLDATATAWEALGRSPQPDLAQGLLALGLGRSDEAVSAFEKVLGAGEASVFPDAIAPRSFVPHLVEAYLRAGRPENADAALRTFESLATRSRRPASQALSLRCRAAIDGSEPGFEAAFAEHERWGNPYERARTELLYGELLRRRRRRADARVRLRAALEVFDELGAEGWAELTRTALRATGHRARRRDPSTIDVLTPQETTVARLVVTGLTNREVAARLFLSPKTIETHLAHVFRKTGVRTRAELAHRFRDSPDSIEASGS